MEAIVGSFWVVGTVTTLSGGWCLCCCWAKSSVRFPDQLTRIGYNGDYVAELGSSGASHTLNPLLS